MPKPKYASQADWWEFISKKSERPYRIAWTSDVIEVQGQLMHGAVRARLDDKAQWEYYPCSNARYAMSFGEEIIHKQKRLREGLVY